MSLSVLETHQKILANSPRKKHGCHWHFSWDLLTGGHCSLGERTDKAILGEVLFKTLMMWDRHSTAPLPNYNVAVSALTARLLTILIIIIIFSVIIIIVLAILQWWQWQWWLWQLKEGGCLESWIWVFLGCPEVYGCWSQWWWWRWWRWQVRRGDWRVGLGCFEVVLGCLVDDGTFDNECRS